jgi:hypothetical protein
MKAWKSPEDRRQGFSAILSMQTCGFDAGEAIILSAWLNGRLLYPWPKLQGFATTCHYGVHESIEKPWRMSPGLADFRIKG